MPLKLGKRPQIGYHQHHVRSLTGGILTDMPSTAIADGQSPDYTNWRIYRARLQKRGGYALLNAGGLRRVMYTGIFYRRNAATQNVLLTDRDLYRDTGTAWTTVSPTATFTGDETSPFSVVTAQDKLCFVNGVDTIKAWDGVAADSFTSETGTTAPGTCRVLVPFANRLIALRTTEGGTVFKQRGRWTIDGPVLAANNTDWSGTGSGSADMFDSEDDIQNGVLSLDTLVVYRERSIYHWTRTGRSTAPFLIQLRISNEGLLVPFSVVDLGGVHFLMGNRNIYLYDYARLTPIGDAVRDAIYGNLNYNRLRQMFAVLNDKFGEVWLFLIKSTDLVPSDVWVWSIKTGVWSKFTFPGITPRRAGVVNISAGTTSWSAASGSWLSHPEAWIPGDVRGVALGTEEGSVMQFDGTSVNDNSAVITATWESKDFDLDLPNRLKTLLRVDIGHIAFDPHTLFVAVSTDGGMTYGLEESMTMAGSLTNTTMYASSHMMVTGITFRVKIRTADAANQVVLTELKLVYSIGPEALS